MVKDVSPARGFEEALLTSQDGSNDPVLFRLNADTSFLLSYPYPSNASAPQGRCRYNILIDPWLQGPQSDVASWFSTQWHAIESSVATLKELNDILGTAELNHLKKGDEASSVHAEDYIDLVVISHEFTDHCHQSTLLELSPSVPVIATTKAVELMAGWKHFQQVLDMPAFGAQFDWHASSITPLPSWLGVSRLVTEGNSLYYHSAVVICASIKDDGVADAVIYTPHGVEASSFGAVAQANPEVRVLAFLHGLHDVSLRWTKQLNLGAHNALKAQKQLKAKYWIATHDEVKRGGGLIKPLLQRKAYTLQDAIDKDQKTSFELPQDALNVSIVELGNGQSMVLA